MKIFYKKIEDVPPELVKAYDDKKYSFDPVMLPSQAHTKWDKVAWINYVWFSPELERLRTKETDNDYKS